MSEIDAGRSRMQKASAQGERMQIRSKATPPRARPHGQFCVLMTATIRPKGRLGTELVRSDPGVRLADYVQGLQSWLELSDPRVGGVVLAENSGYPRAALEAAFSAGLRSSRSFEIISCDAPPPPEGLSYGYSEFALVDHALEHSKLLGEFSGFVKATGRYQFPSISRLLDRLPSDFRFAADCTGYRPFGMRSIPILSAALLLTQREFFVRELRHLYREMVPAPPWTRKQFIEAMFYDHLYPMRKQAGVVLRWPCNCSPVGIGANGDDYGSPRKKVTNLLRAFLRRVAPELWV
ncbi:MAG: hypothetical protein ABI639_07390 [Thermoanaerobaculia bacterium]